jgi:hypothetical protein
LPVFEQMLLHLVDHLGGPMDADVRTTDMQVRLARGNLHAQGPTQEPKMAVGGAEQFQLFLRV